MKQEYQYTCFAYFDMTTSKLPIWRLTTKDSNLYKTNPSNVKFIGVPTPVSKPGQLVYIPTKCWYKAVKIKEIEPVFIRNNFDRFLYCLENNHQLAMSEDFFTTKYEAIKRAWKNTITIMLYRITGKI